MDVWWEWFFLCNYQMSPFVFLLVPVRLEAVQQLTVETVSEGSVRVRWRGVSGARAYRLVWGPFTGQDKGRVNHLAFISAPLWYLFEPVFKSRPFARQGRDVETVEVPVDSEFYTLSRLQADTEYIVTIIPLYEGNTEGPVATARFKIGRWAFSCSPLHKTSVSAYCESSSLVGLPPHKKTVIWHSTINVIIKYLCLHICEI